MGDLVYWHGGDRKQVHIPYTVASWRQKKSRIHHEMENMTILFLYLMVVLVCGEGRRKEKCHFGDCEGWKLKRQGRTGRACQMGVSKYLCPCTPGSLRDRAGRAANEWCRCQAGRCRAAIVWVQVRQVIDCKKGQAIIIGEKWPCMNGMWAKDGQKTRESRYSDDEFVDYNKPRGQS